MAEPLDRLARDVLRVLTSIRRSLDAPYINPRRFGSEWPQLKRLYLAFEDIRYTFDGYVGRSRNVDLEQWQVASQELLQALSDILDNDDFREPLKIARFRLLPMSRTPESVFLERFMQDGLSVREAATALGDLVWEYRDNPPGQQTLELPAAEMREPASEKIKRIVPASQKVAPVQFDIVDYKIVVVPQPAEVLPEDRRNVEAARSELLANGEKIIEQLNNSNCDRRLLENVQDLQCRLQDDVDIVRLGLASIGCEIMISAFAEELPTAVAAMLRSQTFGVNMYVGQFPEWHRFTEQAATAQLSEADVPTISSAAKQLVERLREAPEAADPEVPRVLEALNLLLADPRSATKRAIYAVWRSIENLVIKVFRYGTDFIDQTITKSIDQVSAAAARAIVVVLMSAALSTAISLTPVASHIAESAWIARAVEIVKDQIGTLG